jgi:hypothetical protein
MMPASIAHMENEGPDGGRGFRFPVGDGEVRGRGTGGKRHIAYAGQPQAIKRARHQRDAEADGHHAGNRCVVPAFRGDRRLEPGFIAGLYRIVMKADIRRLPRSNEGLTGKVFQIGLQRKGQGMVFRKCCHQRFAQHHMGRHTFRNGRGRADEGEVQIAVGNLGQLQPHLHFDQLQLHIGMGSAETGDGSDHKTGIGGRGDITDGDAPGFAAIDAFERRKRRLGIGEDLPGILVEKLAGCGQLHRAARAVEKRHADNLFERHDLLAQARLGNAEAGGGALEIALIHQRGEIAQVAQFERFCPACRFPAHRHGLSGRFE